MFSTYSVIMLVIGYMAVLFGIAQWVEKRLEGSGNTFKSPWIYALSLAIYHTSWTFYGSVGFAATSGLLFFCIYIGSLISIAFWWSTQRRMVQAKETFHITSIADFISTRYNRSQKIAGVVTLIAIIGVMPYIALQLTAITSSYNLITHEVTASQDWELSGILTTGMMIAFTILFGARRLDPTERHQGMVIALVVECLVKLAAFLAIGIFVTYHLYDGFGDIINRLHEQQLSHVISISGDNGYTIAVTLIVLSFFAVQCLPRQFHMGVVENTDQNHIKTAMWVFPLYIIAINIFVLPIAGAGLLSGYDIAQADYFVLLLPQLAGQNELTLVAFIGGFSAATGMIIVTTMTLSTMVSNHLVLPLIERINLLSAGRAYLLQIRWAVITLILTGSYWFANEFSESHILVAIGLISFVAVFQFAPAMFGGIFWNRGNSAGALIGLAGGALVWFYTMVLPTFVRQGWFDAQLMTEGPLGISLLRPEALMGVEGLPAVTHSLLWSGLANISLYVIGSLIYKPHKNERNLTTEFIYTMQPKSRPHRARPTGLDAYIVLEHKLAEAQSLLSSYLSDDKASSAIHTIAEDLQVLKKAHITIIELVEFHRMVEHTLAGSIGAASAHSTMENSIRYTEREAADLQALYSHIVTELGGQNIVDAEPSVPAQEQGSFGLIEDLQSQIDKLQTRVQKQDRMIQEMEEKLEHRYEEIFRYRLEAQKAQQENKNLQKELEERIRLNM
ncbi:sodium:solute symporter family protein [Marinobacterium jannaschii]|uniref:sodium:solute symporter family protein n=1 Tax=Marinobacterium jannaschii TaxID=64970 RepID=UPI0005667866|nr:membrane protein [Marinobacterium jannaschii]